MIVRRFKMTLKELVIAAAVSTTAALGMTSDANAQFPSTCAPATCAPKVQTVWEERTVIRNVPVTRLEQREKTTYVPKLIWEERKSVVEVPVTRCEPKEFKEYRRVCVEQPAPVYTPSTCAPATCMPKACNPVYSAPATCAPRHHAPATCAPKQCDRYPGRYIREACESTKGFVHKTLDSISEHKIENKYKQIQKIQSREAARDLKHSPMPRNAPYRSLGCFGQACVTPGMSQTWNSQGWNAPVYSEPAQVYSPVAPAPMAVPMPPIPTQ